MIEVPAVYCLNSLFYKFTNICCTFNYTCSYQFILETAILGSETIPPIRSRCSSTSYMKFVIYTNNSKVPHQTLFSWSGNNSKVPHQTLFSWSGNNSKVPHQTLFSWSGNNSKVPHQTLFSWSGNNSKVPHQTLFSWSGNNSKVPHQTLFSWSGNNSKVPHQTLFSWSGHETNYLQGMEGWADKAGCNHN